MMQGNFIQNAYLNYSDKNFCRYFKPVLVPGENHSFYINEEPIDDPSFSDFRLALFYQGQNIADDIGTLQQVFVDGPNYQIICEFTCPIVDDKDYYQLIIYNSDTNQVIYGSSYYELRNSLAFQDSAYVIYRNSRDTYNFNYTLAPEFFNKVRLRVNRIDLQNEGNIEPYRSVSSGRLRNVRTNLDRYITLQLYQGDQKAHEAMYIMGIHDYININGRNYINKSNYTIDTNVISSMANGQLELYDQEFSSINRYCGNCY